ncbi:hypothetical protein SCYZ1_1 [Pseudomonas phage SCYZ1]|nr:hypothetical protein SCYZ1_1 [Pseudomonas phage SCYZ1]
MNAAQKKHADQQGRRKIRNKLHRNGDPAKLLKQGEAMVGPELADGSRKVVKGDQLLLAKVRAESKFGKLGQLNRLIDTGTPEQKVAARRAKAAMNVFTYGGDKTNTDDVLRKDKGVRDSKAGMASASRSATTSYTLSQLNK